MYEQLWGPNSQFRGDEQRLVEYGRLEVDGPPPDGRERWGRHDLQGGITDLNGHRCALVRIGTEQVLQLGLQKRSALETGLQPTRPPPNGREARRAGRHHRPGRAQASSTESVARVLLEMGSGSWVGLTIRHASVRQGPEERVGDPGLAQTVSPLVCLLSLIVLYIFS